MPVAAPTAYLNARLVDPLSGYDGPGCVVVQKGAFADIVRRPNIDDLSSDIRIVDCSGAMLAPGLVDLRVKTGEPGAETKETLASAARAAAAGGVTTFVVQPDTDPAIDEPSVADFVLRRARDIGEARIFPAGAATKALGGERMAEIGLLAEAGCVYITDVDHSIVDSRVLRRILTYARGHNMLVAHRPADPWLTDGAAANESEFAGRLGLPSVPAEAEQIMLERDIALAQLTGASLMVDQISTAGALATLRRAKDGGLPVIATCSINHLSFNELDIGDYRTFCKLTPPLRSEEDRQALIEALAEGLVDIVVSAHAPAPAEDKRLPYDEAAPGAVGLETLLPALLTLHHDGGIPLPKLLHAVSHAPAKALGLKSGVFELGQPADMVLCDLFAPVVINTNRLLSKSKNTPFDGRRLQGQVLMTILGGQVVHRVLE